MDGLVLKQFCSGELLNNAYLVFDPGPKKGFTVDCPAYTEELAAFIEAEGLEILFIALTHAHFDHIAGLNDYPFPFYVQKEDVPLLKIPELNGSLLFGRPVIIEKKPLIYPVSQSLDFCGRRIKVIATPGHTPGSVSLRLDKWLFAGDTLFFDSVGRTDIPLASQGKLTSSIKEKILTLPEETVVYPGHGPSTTVGREKKHNPFIG